MTHYAYHALSNSFYHREDIALQVCTAQVEDSQQRPIDPNYAEATLPAGYVEVSEDEHAALFAAQSQGMVIQPDLEGTGRPVALPPPAPTQAELLQHRAANLRDERDRRIAATDYLMAADYPLDAAQRALWVAYRQNLRGLPQVEGFPWDGGGTQTPWPVQPC